MTKADVQQQAQPIVQQQTTPPCGVSATSQQAAQTPSSPAPPQRPARRKQAQPPAAAHGTPDSGQTAASQQQTTPSSAAQAPPASAAISQKSAETVSDLPLTIHAQEGGTLANAELIFPPCTVQTPPTSPKPTGERGHQRTPSDAAANSVVGAPATDSSLQPQGADRDAAPSQ